MFGRSLPVFIRRSVRSLNTAPDYASKLRGLGSGTVDLDLTDKFVARLTINNPTRRNALSGNVLAQFSDAIDTLEREYKGVCVVVRGAGGMFSSGADLKLMKDFVSDPASCSGVCNYVQAQLLRFRALPLISLAVVEGYAIGAGAELTLAADYRLLAADAVIHFKQAFLAHTTAWGGGTALTHIIGRRNALNVLCSSAPVPAKRALDIGLADVVTTSSAPADMEAAIHTFVKPYVALASLNAGTGPAIRASKLIVANADVAEDVGSAMAYERDVFTRAWSTPVNEAAVTKTADTITRGR
jgi:ethylmalonyl-CoA/methylmalonyl-CoA decarboxylase